MNLNKLPPFIVEGAPRGDGLRGFTAFFFNLSTLVHYLVSYPADGKPEVVEIGIPAEFDGSRLLGLSGEFIQIGRSTRHGYDATKILEAVYRHAEYRTLCRHQPDTTS